MTDNPDEWRKFVVEVPGSRHDSKPSEFVEQFLEIKLEEWQAIWLDNWVEFREEEAIQLNRLINTPTNRDRKFRWRRKKRR